MNRFSNRIGVIVPFDMALDREYWDLVPDDVTLHITRLGIVDMPYGPDHARAVAEPAGLLDAARTLVRIDPEVVAFGCASASFVDGPAGEARVRDAIAAAGIADVTTPSGALVEELHRIGARRVGLGTPYEADLGEALAAFLEASGFVPVSLVNLAYTAEEDVINAGAEVVSDLARRAMRPDADAVFLACTNLPTVPLLSSLGHDLGVPVLSANQVLMDVSVRRLGSRRSAEADLRAGS